MLDVKNYYDLHQVNRLYEQKNSLLDEIEQEKLRLERINRQKSQRALQLTEDQTQLATLELQIEHQEREIDLLQTSLNQLEQRMPALKSEQEIRSTENEIKFKQETLDQLEERTIELYEQQDRLKTSIDEAITFLKGVEITLQKIQVEVDQLTHSKMTEIQNLDERIQTLINNLSDLARILIQRSIVKYPQSKKVALVKMGKCDVCKSQLTSIMKEEIETFKQFYKCPSCSRVLIPEHLPAEY